jgi:hypothetical protein
LHCCSLSAHQVWVGRAANGKRQTQTSALPLTISTMRCDDGGCTSARPLCLRLAKHANHTVTNQVILSCLLVVLWGDVGISTKFPSRTRAKQRGARRTHASRTPAVRKCSSHRCMVQGCGRRATAPMAVLGAMAPTRQRAELLKTRFRRCLSDS